MELTIRFEGEGTQRADHWKGLAFSVWAGEESVCTVEVSMSNTADTLVSAHYSEYASEEHRGADPERVWPALIRYGVRRLVRELSSREGRAALIDAGHTLWTITGHESLGELFEPLGPKGCEWQIGEGRDLFCVASLNDPAASLVVDGRPAAPTTRAACEACEVPDESGSVHCLAIPTSVRTTRWTFGSGGTCSGPCATLAAQRFGRRTVVTRAVTTAGSRR